MMLQNSIKYILLVLICLVFTGISNAQQTKEKGLAFTIEKNREIAREIGLTDKEIDGFIHMRNNQKKELEPLVLKRRELRLTLTKLMSNHSANEDDILSLSEKMKETDKAIRKLQIKHRAEIINFIGQERYKKLSILVKKAQEEKRIKDKFREAR